MEGWYIMKIINCAIIFVICFLPIMFLLDMKKDQVSTAKELSIQYNRGIDAAVQDAAKTLLINVQQQYESSYGSLKFTKANKKEAINSFLKTLSTNFGIEDQIIGQGVLKAYIPVIAIVDYKGFSVFAMEEYRQSTNESVMDLVEMPFKPYTYKDNQGNMLSFTLDDYVTVYDASQQKWVEGFREEIASEVTIPLLQDPDLFENVRRSTILHAIQEDIQYYINRHNTYAKRFGITYTFTMPIISQEDWHNTIDDIGVIAFIQGVPLGGGHVYNHYALGGSRLTKSKMILTTTLNGIKYYYREDCGFPYTGNEVFTSEKEAAKHGYQPLSCFNQ